MVLRRSSLHADNSPEAKFLAYTSIYSDNDWTGKVYVEIRKVCVFKEILDFIF